MTDRYEAQAEIQNMVHEKAAREPLLFSQVVALCAMSNPEGIKFLAEVFDQIGKTKLAQAAGLNALADLKRISGDKAP